MIEQEPINDDLERQYSQETLTPQPDAEELPDEIQLSRSEFNELILDHLQEGMGHLNELQAQSDELEAYVTQLENLRISADTAEDMGLIVRYYLSKDGRLYIRYQKKPQLGFNQ